MKKIILAILMIFIILVAALSLFIFIKNEVISKTYQISIKNFTFDPNEIIIKKGDTVIWKNTDDYVHTITPNQNDNLQDNKISKGQIFFHTFKTKGIYRYHCDDHESMIGTIIVE